MSFNSEGYTADGERREQARASARVAEVASLAFRLLLIAFAAPMLITQRSPCQYTPRSICLNTAIVTPCAN